MIGSGNDFILLRDLQASLRIIKETALSYVKVGEAHLFWLKGLLNKYDLGLENVEEEEWYAFIQKLSTSNILVMEEEDKLVWAKNLIGGFYMDKLKYEAIFSYNQDQVIH